MARQARTEAKPEDVRAAEEKLRRATTAPEEGQGLRLTEPLFGLAPGLGAGKWCAVRFENGVAVSLSPKRNGRDEGEARHFAVARAVEAMRVAVLGRRA